MISNNHKNNNKVFSRYINKRGKINFYQVRKDYLQNKICDDNLRIIFAKWSRTPEYMQIHGVPIISSITNRPTSNKRILSKVAKRGNDVYKNRVEKRFTKIKELVTSGRNKRIYDITEPNAKTNLLLVTLTYDPKRISKVNAWKNSGNYFNKYKSNLRKQFGKFETIRVSESM